MLSFSLISLLLLLTLLLSVTITPSSSQSIGIIGGGVSGVFTSRFLSDLAPSSSPLSITLYEASHKLGGRVESYKIPNTNITVELGASIAFTGNHYVSNFLAESNLTRRTPMEDRPDSSFGIYNSSSTSFVFKQHPPSSKFFFYLTRLYNKVTLIFRYLFDLPSLFKVVKTSATLFDSIYDLQANLTSFNTPHDLWAAVHLSRYTNQSFHTVMIEEVLSPSSNHRMLNELNSAVNRVNYNAPNTELTALAGFMSHVPMVTGTLFSILEGNDKLFTSVIQKAKSPENIKVALSTRVSKVVYDPVRLSFNLYNGDGGMIGAHDLVVLASPFQQSLGVEFFVKSSEDGSLLSSMFLGLGLDGGGGDEAEEVMEEDGSFPDFNLFGDENVRGSNFPFEMQKTVQEPYKQTVTTFIASSSINPTYFNTTPPLPDSIFFTDQGSESTGLSSITKLANNAIPNANEKNGVNLNGVNLNLYKVFSTLPLTKSMIRAIFSNDAYIIKEQNWSPETNIGGAYPNFAGGGGSNSGSNSDVPFLLFDDGQGRGPAVFYVNAIEGRASAMEISAVGAMNVALMVNERLFGGAKKRSGGEGSESESESGFGDGRSEF